MIGYDSDELNGLIEIRYLNDAVFSGRISRDLREGPGIFSIPLKLSNPANAKPNAIKRHVFVGNWKQNKIYGWAFFDCDNGSKAANYRGN